MARKRLVKLPIAALAALVITTGAAAQPQSAALADARAAIERVRMGQLSVCVLDAEGRPVEGATVRAEQQAHEFLFGCNIYMWDSFSDADARAEYRRRFADLFNFATLPFYWKHYEPVRGQTAYERTHNIARWCREHGITTKGHPLLWNHQASVPDWLPADAADVRRLQMSRVKGCVGEFIGAVETWDVVNEATHYERIDNVITRAWTDAGRIPFVREAFLTARRANPAATLLINDYRVDRAYADTIVSKLVDADGEPLYDAIGLQSHMHAGVWPPEKINEVCDRFAGFGRPLHFAEVTILSGPARRPEAGRWATTPDGELRQADEAEMFYTVLFARPEVEAITWWDLSDAGAWQAAPAGLVRDDCSPKPAYDRLHSLIKGKWWTRSEQSTDANGGAVIRGFRGRYEITAAANGSTLTVDAVISADTDAVLTVRLPD